MPSDVGLLFPPTKLHPSLCFFPPASCGVRLQTCAPQCLTTVSMSTVFPLLYSVPPPIVSVFLRFSPFPVSQPQRSALFDHPPSPFSSSNWNWSGNPSSKTPEGKPAVKNDKYAPRAAASTSWTPPLPPVAKAFSSSTFRLSFQFWPGLSPVAFWPPKPY